MTEKIIENCLIYCARRAGARGWCGDEAHPMKIADEGD